MTKSTLVTQASLEVEDYMDRFDSDGEYPKEPYAQEENQFLTPEECKTEHVKLRMNSNNYMDLSNRQAPTMVIELVQVGRPLKVHYYIIILLTIGSPRFEIYKETSDSRQRSVDESFLKFLITFCVTRKLLCRESITIGRFAHIRVSIAHYRSSISNQLSVN